MSIDLGTCLSAARIVPVLTVRSTALATPLAEALADAGVRCAEVTLRTRESEQVLHAMAAHGRMTIGAGTVLTPDQAERAVAAGAEFIVSPGFDEDVVAACQALGVPVIPGIATATELMRAQHHGINTLKFFPAEQLGGLPTLKALSAPFPTAQFMPTGGIGPDQAADYLALPSVLAVGGSWIAPPDILEHGDFQEIRRRAAQAMKPGTP